MADPPSAFWELSPQDYSMHHFRLISRPMTMNDWRGKKKQRVPCVRFQLRGDDKMWMVLCNHFHVGILVCMLLFL